MKIGLAFTKPQSLAGKAVVWRTYDKYSHSVIVMGDTLYSSQIPRVVKKPVDGYPIAALYEFDVSEETYRAVEAWLESRVGKWYDVLSLVGWLLGIRSIQWNRFHFCHEFCHEALVRAGVLEPTNDFITADNLILSVMTKANQV